MPLQTINVPIAGHFAKGGIKSLKIGDWAVGTPAGAVGANHGCTITASSGEVTIDFEKETAKLTVSTVQEKGLAMSTCSIEAYVPALSVANREALQTLVGVGCYGIVEFWDGYSVVLGWDAILGTEGGTSDFALFLESIEMDSGAALNDQNGATLKLTAVQGEVPRTSL